MSAPAPRLLSRDAFRTQTLRRLQGRCCVPGCQEAAVDAHHILDRRLWPDGGYYLENGAPLCAAHHLDAEKTLLSVADIRAWCAITDPVLPPQFERGDALDKWGNPLMSGGRRLRGELFFDDAVQKILGEAGVLDLFTHWVKHPKTWHMPHSPGVTNDDRKRPNMDHFHGKRVIMTEKRDGECSSLYSDHMHARSLDSNHHPSRDWLKSFWASIRHDIPEGYRVVGEGLFAAHSVPYHALPTWFEGIFMWDDKNQCLSWDDTLDWFALIGTSVGLAIQPVPVLYDGLYDEKAIQARWNELLAADKEAAGDTGVLQEREGYVIRTADAFAYRDFRTCVAKYVRPNHVQTDEHWMHGPIVANKLA